MTTSRMPVLTVTLLIAGLGTPMAGTQLSIATTHTEDRERARVAFSHALPKLDGSHLKASVVEVQYGPGESSPQHSHPCSVIGYVVDGTIRTQIEGEPEATYKAGEAFYEPPNGLHEVSANASQTQPATLIAYFVCDHNMPLSINVPEHTHAKEPSR
ncbi:MAG: cupin domain-containing protein [Candidatus Sulfotelmatobacter sp.]|jgi:quercetin dioxygenase-like cupin family protein